MTAKPISDWLVPGLLLALGALNVLFGALPLTMIQQGPLAVPDVFTSRHYFEAPIPIVLHIISGIIFNLLDPLPFVVERVLLRKRRSASGSIKSNLKEAL